MPCAKVGPTLFTAKTVLEDTVRVPFVWMKPAWMPSTTRDRVPTLALIAPLSTAPTEMFAKELLLPRVRVEAAPETSNVVPPATEVTVLAIDPPFKTNLPPLTVVAPV